MSEKNVVVLAGNPRPGSRTAKLGARVGERVAEELGGLPVELLDLAELAASPFSAGAGDEGRRERLDAALQAVQRATVLIVASPTYKATYTGLLKVFLDDLRGPAPLTGVVAVAVMTAGAADHGLAADWHLRPLLLELGAVVPTASVPVVEAELDDLDGLVGRWLEKAGPLLQAVTGAPDRG